jgi:hypothetical protein
VRACCLGSGSLCVNVVKCSEVLELLVRCFWDIASYSLVELDRRFGGV